MADFIREVLEAKGDVKELVLERGIITKIVDFLHESPSEALFGGTYSIMISPTIIKSARVACTFPTHPKPSSQILFSDNYRSLKSFNKDINQRFSECLESTMLVGRTKFGIAYGDQFYRCQDISGTIYVLWAEYITRKNVGNVINTVHTNCPIIVNCNGQYGIKSIFILRTKIEDPKTELSLLPIAPSNPELIIPRDNPFVCETVLPQDHPERVSVVPISYRDAIAKVRDTTKHPSQWLPLESTPFTDEKEVTQSDCEVPLEIIRNSNNGNPEPDPFQDTEEGL